MHLLPSKLGIFLASGVECLRGCLPTDLWPGRPGLADWSATTGKTDCALTLTNLARIEQESLDTQKITQGSFENLGKPVAAMLAQAILNQTQGKFAEAAVAARAPGSEQQHNNHQRHHHQGTIATSRSNNATATDHLPTTTTAPPQLSTRSQLDGQDTQLLPTKSTPPEWLPARLLRPSGQSQGAQRRHLARKQLVDRSAAWRSAGRSQSWASIGGQSSAT